MITDRLTLSHTHIKISRYLQNHLNKYATILYFVWDLSAWVPTAFVNAYFYRYINIAHMERKITAIIRINNLSNRLQIIKTLIAIEKNMQYFLLSETNSGLQYSTCVIVLKLYTGKQTFINNFDVNQFVCKHSRTDG